MPFIEHISLIPIIIILFTALHIITLVYSSKTADEIVDMLFSRGVLPYIIIGFLFWITFEAVYWLIFIINH